MTTKRSILAALAFAAASLMPALSEAHPGGWHDHGRRGPHFERHHAYDGHRWSGPWWRHGHGNVWGRDHYVREHRGHYWVPAHPARHEPHRDFRPGHRGW